MSFISIYYNVQYADDIYEIMLIKILLVYFLNNLFIHKWFIEYYMKFKDPKIVKM